jgi:hypothetical protein
MEKQSLESFMGTQVSRPKRMLACPRRGLAQQGVWPAGLALAASALLLLGGCQPQNAPEPEPPAAPALPPTSGSGGQSNSATPNSTEAPTGSAAASLQEKGRSSGLVQGHAATVACLRGERAQTDGNELRCEDWAYVRQNYASAR